jgi:FlaG/FlaF family flagellin (archaellin)
MAAIALILAAVIGAFVLGFGEENTESAPTVSADLDREEVDAFVAGNERIIITHNGGDAVPISELQILTEAQCFDDATLVESSKRGRLVNLPVDFSSGIDNAENVEGDEIFATQNNAIQAPLKSSSDENWQSGERLTFQISDAECGIESNAEVTVEVIHEPTNSRIVEETLGGGFQPAALENEFDPATAGDTSTHTWALNGITYGSSGDQVDEITVDYDPNNNGVNADYGGLNQDDITVIMTRTCCGGLDRSVIDVNNDNYGGSSATFDLNGGFTTDVAGPIEIEIDGIENPSSTGSFQVDITLDGDAGQKTFTETLEIEN